jgi:hypothetical protein
MNAVRRQVSLVLGHPALSIAVLLALWFVPASADRATVQLLSFVKGDAALHLVWKENHGADVGWRQAELRLKELAAQLQMVSAENARREDDILSANTRIRQMEEAAAAHAAQMKDMLAGASPEMKERVVLKQIGGKG